MASVVARRAAEISAVADRVAAGWAGTAGSAAAGHVRALREPLDAARLAFVETDQVLSRLAAALSRARARLASAVAAAAPANVEIDRDGRTAPASTVTGIDRVAASRAADRVGASIAGALGAAEVADRAAATGLARLRDAAEERWPVSPPPLRPGFGAPPAVVVGWWRSLTDAERRWLVLHDPAWVGRLDGIPVAARDQANRAMLAGQRAELMRARAAALSGDLRPLSGVWESHRLVRLMSGIDAVDARLSAETGDRAYLLSLVPHGDGQVVLAVGDPDHADNVLTYVPGMTADLGAVRDDLSRADAMAHRAASLDATQTTSTVLWLGYDAPDFLHEAAFRTKAEEAGPALHRFAEGLRATHEGPPAQQTVLGHSYGSLAVGSTAHGHGLAADDLVLVGSPGVGVDHASALGAPPTRVWSSTAADDMIGYLAPGPDEPLNRLRDMLTWPPVHPRPNEDLWFGRNPTDPSFGAHVFAGQPRGHSGYWHPDNDTLDDIARIALGPEHHGDVR